ncbi:MAG TPA: cytochrome c3 family protein [Candidatus Acidoferrales bacterium]|nr:cytochrome c3 family protein [Candidatus Acidoferrales bacterium]
MRTPAILFLLCCGLRGAGAPDSCITCHTALEDGKGPASTIKNDVHIAHGLSCADCHGGDRSSDDPEVSMSKAKGFKGKPARTDIPKFCAACHSNPDFMRKFAPRERVDQFELYQTSIHGKRLAAGDTKVATCIDCHSVHNIRAVKDAASPVHPLHVAETCGNCHSDKERMAPYKIPTNQLAEYRTSVHWQAMIKRGDLSAPTCSSCHGNHGAKPPQVESIAEVCGSCHVLFEQLYSRSVHKPIFSSASGGGGCIVCHSNHGIQNPSTKMLTGSASVCGGCHDAGTAPANTAAQMAGWLDGLDAAIKQSDAVLMTAEKSGMEVSEAQVRLIEGRENLVKSRLALHGMQPEQMRIPIEAGMAIARETRSAGESALHERDFRRYGLGVSVILIALAILAIRSLIHRIEVHGTLL